jgi:autotransporter-associated beta strand protein
MPQVIDAAIQTNGDMLAVNVVNNGGALVGNGLAGLTLGPITIGGGGTLLVTNTTATTTTVLDGDITDSGGLGALYLQSTVGGGSADLTNSNFVINGNNTYTGPTTIQANTGSRGSIQIGSDSPFGTGTVTNIFQGNSVEFRALNGTRTIPNDFDLEGGMNFAGDNSFVLSGDIYIKSGATRTLVNKITASGKTLTLGDSDGSSKIYLGNPTSNPGGSVIILQANTGATTIVNAKFQDVGAASAVRYGTQNGGNIVINTLQTYTSNTQIGGGEATVQFHHDYNAGDPSGPFGLGTLHANGATNARLAPTGGDRTIANPILMQFGLAFANVSGDTSSVTFSGPIHYTSALGGSNNTRVVNNLMGAAGGIVTFGSAASPSTWTLEAANGQGINFTGSGRTVINDTIQDSVANINNPLIVSNSSTTTFNGPQITDGNFSITGTNSTVIINGPRSTAGGSTLANISMTGNNSKLIVNSSVADIGTVSINSTGTLAGTGTLEGAVSNSGTIAPGTLPATPGTLTLPGNVTNNADSHWLIGLDGTSAGKLVIGGDVDLLAVDSLDVAGTGSGSSWVIATYAGMLSGTFDNVTPGYAVDYGTGSNSQITLMTAALPGDYNGDGRVDAADYVVWRSDPAGHGGDPDGYNTWRDHFGEPPGAGSGSRGPAAVPEPAALLLVLVSVACWPRRTPQRASA